MVLPPNAIELKGHFCRVSKFAALPDGDRLVTSSWDSYVRVFSAARGELLRTLSGHDDGVVCLAALGGDVVASGGFGGSLRVWNVSTGACLHSVSVGGGVRGLAALGVDRFVVSADCALLYFAHCGGHDVMLLHKEESAHEEVIMGVAACGALVATASLDETSAVWNADSYERVAVLEGHRHRVSCVAIDARHVVTGSWDYTMRVYDATTFQCTRVLATVHSGCVRAVSLVGDDCVLSGGDDKTVQLTALSTGKSVEPGISLPFEVSSVGVAEGGWVAAGSSSGIAVLFPLAPRMENADACRSGSSAAVSVSAFRERVAAMRRASCAGIVRLPETLAARLRR
jgi:WD40 repeat protein